MVLQETLNSQNLEVLVIDGLKQTEVKFLFKIDFEFLKSSVMKKKLLNSEILVFISFSGLTFNKVVPELYISPYLKKLVGNTQNLQIPPFTEFVDLVEYVKEIKKIITIKVSIQVIILTILKNTFFKLPIGKFNLIFLSLKK